MKITSIFGLETLVSKKKIACFWEHLRNVSLSEIILCFIVGTLSQGKLFGVIRPFGIAFYAGYIKSYPVKLLMTASIFIGSLVAGDFLIALKQLAVILLFEWINKIFSRDEKPFDFFKRAVFIGSASAITGIFVFLMSGKTMEAILIMFMEAVLIGVLTPVFAVLLNDPDVYSGKGYNISKNIKYLGLLILWAAFLLGISNINLMNISFDRLLASVGILLVARHFGSGAAAISGAVAGMAVSVGVAGSFSAYTGLYAVLGMIAGMLQKSKVTATISFLITQLIFYLLSDDITIRWPELFMAAVFFLIIPDFKEGKLSLFKNRIDSETFESDKMNRIKYNISGKLGDVSKALYKLGQK